MAAATRIWPETNCYVDLWIEVLAAAGFTPEAMLGFTLTQDFEGDQFTFFKVPLEDLESTVVDWCRQMMMLSPMALRMIKRGLNAELDGQAGIQELAGQATHLFYRTAEGQEGRNAFLEKREPDFRESPWLP